MARTEHKWSPLSGMQVWSNYNTKKNASHYNRWNSYGTSAVYAIPTLISQWIAAPPHTPLKPTVPSHKKKALSNLKKPVGAPVHKT